MMVRRKQVGRNTQDIGERQKAMTNMNQPVTNTLLHNLRQIDFCRFAKNLILIQAGCHQTRSQAKSSSIESM